MKRNLHVHNERKPKVLALPEDGRKDELDPCPHGGAGQRAPERLDPWHRGHTDLETNKVW